MNMYEMADEQREKKNEEDEKKEKKRGYGSIRKRRIFIQIFLFILLIIFTYILLRLIKYELIYEKEKEKEILDMYEQKVNLDRQIETLQKQMQDNMVNYVQMVSAKSCIILCFDNFGKSVYTDVIKEMDKYGFKGVIIFRDGIVPGDKGCISEELYRELLDKGWEAAIGNSRELFIYNGIPETARYKWFEYMQDMCGRFAGKGLPIPKVYCPHDGESTTEVVDLLKQIDMQAYTTYEKSAERAATGMGESVILNMGMILGRYDYKSLGTDIETLANNGKSMAVWFRKVEGAMPDDMRNTSIFKAKKILQTLNAYKENVNVTTFSGYNAYQKQLALANQIFHWDYMKNQNDLICRIAFLKEHVFRIYAK